MALDFKMKILLAEDTPSMRKMEIKILKQLGFEQIIEAGNGSEAVEKLQAQPDIKLVISDWNMPGIDGLELLQWMRAHKDFAAIPFLMASGQGDKKSVQIAVEAGASGTVTKPFSPDEMKNTIEECFGIKKEPAAAPAPVAQRADDGRRFLKVAHIQITDHLALGVLKHHIEIGKKIPHGFALETRQGSALRGKQIGIVLTYGDTDLYTSGGINAIHTFESMFRYIHAEIVGIVHGTTTHIGHAEQQPELMKKAHQLGERLGREKD